WFINHPHAAERRECCDAPRPGEPPAGLACGGEVVRARMRAPKDNAALRRRPLMRRWPRIVSLVVALLAPATLFADASERCLAVLSTNDIHGAIEPHETKAGGQTLRSGGIMVLASYLTPLRQ